MPLSLPLFLYLGLLSTIAAVPSPSQAQGPPESSALRFLAIGDVPYSDTEMFHLQTLLRDGAAEDPPFILHVGDIKGGGQACSDARIQGVADLFRSQPVPLLYTPGDNEWTDCHRPRAGGRDPLERLALLRRMMYADPLVLHSDTLSPTTPDPAYPENRYFHHDGILFLLMHVVGSNNNFRDNNAAAMAEHRARAEANRVLLEQAVQAANRLDARAFVLAFHANPLFEARMPRRGFVPVIQNLQRLLAQYPGPVLLIHGDTHRFRFDQPLTDTQGVPIERFTRLEVPGSPSVAGVWVTVQTHVRPAFSEQLVYPTID